MRCGVVLFDSANNIVAGDKTFVSLDNGWASVGGALAVRIQRIHDLASDVLWITNLTEEQFYRAQLFKHPNYRHEGYLRATLRHIYSELGLDPLFVSPDVVASALATVAQRVLDAAAGYGVTPRTRSRALNEDFATAIGAPRSQIPTEFYSMFEGSAQHVYVRPVQENRYLNNSLTLTLRRNRLVHARELLSLSVPPDAHWEYIPRDMLPTSKSAIESMLSQANTAFLVNCEVSGVNPMVADVFSVGGGSKTIRNWLTDIEWKTAREWADIEYNGVLICATSSFVVPQLAALPAGDYTPLSFTSCLIAEQIWTAMTMKLGTRNDHRFTAAAAWIRAMDRMSMFSYAQKLHARGLTVWGYGGGNVVVQYPEGGLRHALDVSTDSGLLIPSSKLLEARRPAAGG